MVELVDTLDLKSNGHYGRAGSSPAFSTDEKPKRKFRLFSFSNGSKQLFWTYYENEKNNLSISLTFLTMLKWNSLAAIPAFSTDEKPKRKFRFFLFIVLRE